MSTKIDRVQTSTTSLPDTPTSAVAASAPPRPAEKLGVEPRAGASVPADTIERADKPGLLDRMRAATKQTLTDPSALATGPTIAPAQLKQTASTSRDLLTSGITQVVHTDLVSPISSPALKARASEHLQALSSRADQILDKLNPPTRREVAHTLIDIASKSAPPLTLDDLQRSAHNGRRVLAELVQAGHQVADAAQHKLSQAKDHLTQAGHDALALGREIVGADSHTERGLIIAREVAERGAAPKAQLDQFIDQARSLHVDRFGVAPFMMLKALEGVSQTIELAEHIHRDADALRELSSSLRPDALKHQVHSLEPGQSMSIHLNVGLDEGVKFEASREVTFSRLDDGPGGEPKYMVSYQRAADVGIKGIEGSAGPRSTFHYPIQGTENLDQFIRMLSLSALGMQIGPPDLKGHLHDDVRVELGGELSLGLSFPALGSLTATDSRSIAVFLDKDSMTPRHIAVKYQFGAAGQLGDAPIALRLPDLDAPNVESFLREQIVQRASSMPGPHAPLLKLIPQDALIKLMEINGNRTDVELALQRSSHMELKLPFGVDALDRTTEIELQTQLTARLGNSSLVTTSQLTIREPSTLFKAFVDTLPPEALVAGLKDGSIDADAIERRLVARGIEPSAVITYTYNVQTVRDSPLGLKTPIGSFGTTKQTTTDHLHIKHEASVTQDGPRKLLDAMSEVHIKS